LMDKRSTVKPMMETIYGLYGVWMEWFVEPMSGIEPETFSLRVRFLGVI